MTPRELRPGAESYPYASQEVVRRWEAEWSSLRRRLREIGDMSSRCA